MNQYLVAFICFAGLLCHFAEPAALKTQPNNIVLQMR
jgi:hypothetical protein